MSSDHERPVEAIVAADDSIEELREFLDKRLGPHVVLFIDLAGSTALKANPQNLWLPQICRFLVDVTRCVVSQSGGRVVKYIGDEVLSVFADDSGELAANRAESCILECEALLGQRGDGSRAKYALDYGECARVDFAGANEDVLGMSIDRCARVAKLCEAGTALATADFVEHSKRTGEWRKLGKLQFKGVASPTEVFQLQVVGDEVDIGDTDLVVRSTGELVGEVLQLREQLATCQEELRHLRAR